MDILIIGSLAYDSVESPEGNFENLLGGSATYAGLASSFHNLRQGGDGVALIGVVGKDFHENDMKLLQSAAVAFAPVLASSISCALAIAFSA